MTEEESRALILERWGATAVDRLAVFELMLIEESAAQNLMSRSTFDHLWTRHFLDSAQLVAYDGALPGPWVDIGSGAGFPGLVVAIVKAGPMILVEPRGRRVSFLRAVVAELGLGHVEIFEGKAEGVPATSARTISARAVASVDKLLAMTDHLRCSKTTLIFPRGRSGRDELAKLPPKWQKLFHVEHSLTDRESLILVANGAP